VRGADEVAVGSTNAEGYDFDADRFGLFEPRDLDRQGRLAFEAAEGAIFVVVRGGVTRGAVVISFAVLMLILVMRIVVMLGIAVRVIVDVVLGQMMMRVQPAAGRSAHQVGGQQSKRHQRMAAEAEHASPAGRSDQSPFYCTGVWRPESNAMGGSHQRVWPGIYPNL
jgi:hypothetical protein